MSEFVEVEWFGREQKIGIVLTYDEYDGFKARMAPLPQEEVLEINEGLSTRWIMEHAAKIPFTWAWGIFGPRMKSEWMKRHLGERSWPTVRYDHRDYDVLTLKEVHS